MGAIGADGVVTPKEDSGTSAVDKAAESGQIHDVSTNNIVLSEFRDADLISKLKGFITGTPITVTWYHQITTNSTTMTVGVAPSFQSSDINLSFLKIEQMEIRLAAPLDYSYVNDTISSQVTGTALLYPGFTPRIGDVFLYQISAGKIGLFKVGENPTRLTLHSETANSVDFHLFKMVTTEDLKNIEDRVREIGIFDKERFLNEDGALINQQEYIDLKYMEKMIGNMTTLFGDRYYSSEYGTIMLDERLYDPYVTEFFRKICGSYYGNKYIELPSGDGNMDNWKKSIYATLMGENPGFPIYLKCIHEPIEYTRWSSLFTMLHGRSMVQLTTDADENGVPYVSQSIFSQEIGAQDEFDMLVTLFIEQNALNTNYLKSQLESAFDLDMEHGFYQIPILIFLCMVVSRAIHTGQETKIIDAPIKPYIHIPFTNSDVANGFVTVNTLLNKAVAIIDDGGELINLGDDLIAYDDSSLTIDITSIMLVKSITEIPGTWNIVVNNHLLIP